MNITKHLGSARQRASRKMSMKLTPSCGNEIWDLSKKYEWTQLSVKVTAVSVP